MIIKNFHTIQIECSNENEYFDVVEFVNENHTRIGLLDDFENDEEIIDSILSKIITLHKISEEKYNELKKFLKL